ncbi:MAG: binding domain protein excisionase family [Pseudonocardiales bacterium]|nr:binding domain protein excisionase family [Pseudonocardiales bacterium]
MTRQIRTYYSDPADYPVPVDDPMPHPVPSLATVTGRLLLTPEQAAERIGVCRTTLFHLLKTGQVRSVQIGRSRRITPAALVEYVSRLVEASGGDGV